MKIALFRRRHRGEHHQADVRTETHNFELKYADRAHAEVVKKLQRTDLTSHYRSVLEDTEKALRPRTQGLFGLIGLGKN